MSSLNRWMVLRCNEHKGKNEHIKPAGRFIWFSTSAERKSCTRLLPVTHRVLANVAISELLDEYRYTPEAKAFHEDFAKQLFPVSIDWEPPFAMLVPIKKHGDRLVSDCLCHVLLTLPNTQQSPTLDCKIAAKMDQTSVLRATQITTLHKAVAL